MNSSSDSRGADSLAPISVDAGSQNALVKTLLVILLGTLVAVPLTLLLVPEHSRRVTGFVLTAIVAALALVQIRRGQAQRGYRIIAYGSWIAISIAAAVNGGMKSPAILVYPVLVLIAGWVLGRRTIFTLAGLTLATELVLVIATRQHWLPEQTIAPDTWILVVHTVVIAFSTALAIFIGRGFSTQVDALTRHNEELARQHSLNRALLDALSQAGIAMFIIEDGRISQANAALWKICGRDEKELQALADFTAIIHPDDREQTRAGYEHRLTEAAGEYRHEISIVTKNGERRQVEFAVAALPGAEHPRVLAVMVDVTAREAAHEAARQSEARFTQIFNMSPVGISVTRIADGRFLEANNAILNLLGWRREEMVGHTVVELGILPDEAERQARVDVLIPRRAIENVELTLRTKAGASRILHVSAGLLDFTGQPSILTFMHDITEQRHAEMMLREIVMGTARVTGEDFFHALVSHLAHALDVSFALVAELRPGDAARLHALAFWTEDRFAAETAYEIDGTPCDMVFGREPRLVSEGLRIAFPNAELARAIGAESYFGHPLHGASGEPLGILAIMDKRPLPPSEERASLMSIFAARAAAELERLRSEAEVRRLNTELEGRVRSRTAELTEANRELESFAYSISHDLRAPLRGVDGFSRLLQEEYGDRLDVQGNEYLARVRRAAQRLGALIDDLLELSRVTRHEMRRLEVDFSALVADIVEDLRKAEPERRVEVAVEPGCTARGDPMLLRVMLENLLGNAWKYSRNNPAARIEFGRETTAGEACYFVRDNGVGFDMTYAGKLFTPFQRLHKPSEFEGSGIGLASAARVVRRHGGRIWAESGLGAGAVFRFTLGEHCK